MQQEVNAAREVERVGRRRRLLFSIGMTAMTLTVAAALGLGTGCIFDDGSGYQGGGRRTGAPTSSEDQSPLPNPTSSTTSTGSSTSSSTSTSPTTDSGGPQVGDAG